jgi:hypothetical protein
MKVGVNNARVSGAQQPIKLLEKHYPPPEYRLQDINDICFNRTL